MDYDLIIDLDNVTLEDCIVFAKNGKDVILNDGKIKGWEVKNGNDKSD